MTSSDRATAPLHIDADLKRRTEEFLATNPVLSKKLDNLDRVLMGHFLQTQLQDERNGWRGTLAKAMEELERHRKLTLRRPAGAEPPGEEYQIRRQFTDYMEAEEADGGPPEETATRDRNLQKKEEKAMAASSSEALRLRAQLAEARDEATAAAELAWYYENFIRELKSINTKLEARLTQLMHERRRCLKLLLPVSAADAPEHSDLYKAIRKLQNRHEQHTREQHEERNRQLTVAAAAAGADQHQQQLCAACGSVLSSTPRSSPQDAEVAKETHTQQTGGVGSIVGWKRGRMFSRPADIAIVPLRPKHEPQQQQQQQQQQPEAPPIDPSLPERLSEAQTENVRLRRDLQALARALRAAEDDAKEKAERLAACEKQIASMKHAFTYRQQQQQQRFPYPGDSQLLADADPAATGSLPMLNLRHTQKRASQQQPLSERGSGLQQQQQQVMPAKTSVTRCLRCQKLYRLVDNNKFACKYHSKGKQRREQHNSHGKLADVLFVWDCCGRLANADGCCYSEHI